MSVVYKCRHCGHVIGKLDQQRISTQQLGLNELSIEDKKDMVQVRNNGDVLIHVICESCEDTLGNNPHYHELDYFLQ